MTAKDNELIEGLVKMEEQAAEIGLCAAPFMLVRESIEQMIRDRDAAEKRYNAAVEILSDINYPPCTYTLNNKSVDNMMAEDGWCDSNCVLDNEGCWRRYFAIVTDTEDSE